MRALVIGATGLLGRHIMVSAPNGVEVVGASRSRPETQVEGQQWIHLDLLSPSTLRSQIARISPDLVIHTGGESRVDAARDDEAAARASIVGGTANLIDALGELATKLVYISSNAVFGEIPGAIRSNSPYGPINTYGELKVAAEQEVLMRANDALIIRPLLTYGWSSRHLRPNVIETWLRKLLHGQEIRALVDVTNQPMYAYDCASSIWRLATGNETKVANIGGPMELSMYDLATVAARVFGADSRLVQASTALELGLPARRASRVVFAREDYPELRDRIPIGPEEGLSRMRLEMLAGGPTYTPL